MARHKLPGEDGFRSNPSVQLGSSGPTRVDSSKDDPDFMTTPVGFTAQTVEGAKSVRLGSVTKKMSIEEAEAVMVLVRGGWIKLVVTAGDDDD